MIEVGKQMLWRKIVSNYGHEHMIPVTVLKVGKKITVEATNKWGAKVRVVVTPQRLREIKPEPNADPWKMFSADD